MFRYTHFYYQGLLDWILQCLLIPREITEAYRSRVGGSGWGVGGGQGPGRTQLGFSRPFRPAPGGMWGAQALGFPGPIYIYIYNTYV